MESLTNKEVDALLRYLGDLYYRCKAGIETNHKRTFIQCVDKNLSMLEETHEIILRKTYFEKNESKWWAPFYSRTTYYRERSRAARIFLRCVM